MSLYRAAVSCKHSGFCLRIISRKLARALLKQSPELTRQKEVKMANQNDRDDRPNSKEPNSKKQTGDPGRTPGTAEGDRQTVEEDLRDKEKEGKI